jgi:glutamate dehydrogenase
MVDIDEKDVKLPDGTVVESGLQFRNFFHLNPMVSADFFVPCGGRPAAVNDLNVQQLWDAEKRAPRFRYIVEGANLFFTQKARLIMEKWGVVLFKDASANKGGVTSSSLEVLAALALSDEEHAQHMVVHGDVIPPFYQQYVTEVQAHIQKRARDEFDALWTANQRTKVPMCQLTEQFAEKINTLFASIIKADSLWLDIPLRRHVIAQITPPSLVSLLGIDRVMERVPENYLRAMFAVELATGFVYSSGLDANAHNYFEFMQAQVTAAHRS